MNDLDAELNKQMDALMQEPVVFMATGDTYPHRETLQSWGWYWSAARRAWLCEGETTASASRVYAVTKLPGVIVTKLEVHP